LRQVSKCAFPISHTRPLQKDEIDNIVDKITKDFIEPRAQQLSAIIENLKKNTNEILDEQKHEKEVKIAP
jgi:hypothetical protein